jgi:hypothetical protein
MAILNATAIECDRVNFSWSVSVQQCQQIVETVAASHKSTLTLLPGQTRHRFHSLHSPQIALISWGLVSDGENRAPSRSTADLAVRIWVLVSVRLARL